MRFLLLAPVAALLVAAACSSPDPSGPPAPPAPDDSCAGPCPATAIKHVVIVIQENHTFDDHFGRYCTAPAGSNPTCNDGPACCEAAPDTDPAGTPFTTLTDQEMAFHDPDHTAACESEEMDGGKMDKYATASCGSKQNVVLADPAVVKPYWDMAAGGALADRYFQPLVGQSSANDMYFARASWVFDDNAFGPKDAVGITCSLGASTQMEFTGTTIGDLLTGAGVPWTFYAEGYADMAAAVAQGTCPTKPDDCPSALNIYPCGLDPSDIPFEYYASTRDDPQTMKDLAEFQKALDGGGLPAVSFIKGRGYHTEHPGLMDKLSDGVAFVQGISDAVFASRYREDTLLLVTYDEGGGYFDHVTPPPDSTVDQKPYGTRVPLLAVGPFAKKNFVSHVVMEHSSVVKFLEWNFLGQKTGQLQTRDAVVADIGSLLDPAATGTLVPEN